MSPEPEPNNPSAVPRSTQIGMAVLALFLAGMLLWHGYTESKPLPLQQEHGSIAYRIDVNTATEAELQLLPGVGPSLAGKIHAHRGNNGPYQSIDDLQQVPGIGQTTLNTLKPWIETSPSNHLPQPQGDVELLQRKPIVPPKPSWSVGPQKLQPGDGFLDVNAATEADLQRLPGVGSTLAHRIVVERGIERFIDVDDMRRVQGIGAKTLEKIRPHVVVTQK